MFKAIPENERGYESFMAGDMDQAGVFYSEALKRDSTNRDALLGLAAVALGTRRIDKAVEYYSRLLELNPSDPEALAGLINIQGQADPAQSESRLKMVLTANPKAMSAHFALGNLYARQSRWAAAQQSFFQAYTLKPESPDYAFNLAVSLDHMGQSKPALEYYLRAVDLALSAPANFDRSVVLARIRDLEQGGRLENRNVQEWRQ
jgi:tetratricopeptide (TPR) repeat protein